MLSVATPWHGSASAFHSTKQRESTIAESSLVTTPSNRRVFAITVAYEGTRYSGWQVQPGRRTVQGELERVISPLAGVDTTGAAGRVLGSGRTDAGVHAIGQVARCMMPNWNASADALLRAINSKLSDDIVVSSIREARGHFHPIADATGKRYRYQVQAGGQRDPFSIRTWHRVVAPIHLELLQAAASRFLGTHDFAAFQSSGAPRNSTVRTITVSHWIRSETSPNRWIYEVQGNGFLYNMVRNLVGTMLEVGRERRSVEWVDSVLASLDRKQAGPTAPPQGLFLCHVHYPDELFFSVG